MTGSSAPEPSGPAVPAWRVLGPLEGDVAGRPLDPGPPLRQALLALLLAHGGRPVSMDALVTALWGEQAPAGAVNGVHKHVGALRRAVEPGLARRAQGSWLVPTADGYRVALEAVDLDLDRFRLLVSRADREASAHQRLQLLLDALGLWRGRAAEGLDPEHRSHRVFDQLDREFAKACVEAADLAVAQGRAGDVVTALREASVAYPTDEAVHARLVLALAATGRRIEALEHYEGLRARLADDFGVDPGPELGAAHLAVLRDELPAADRRAAWSVPAELPADTAAFAGRAVELDRLRELLVPDDAGPSTPVVAITGAPGVGKSALAVRAAHLVADHFPDGQVFVDLQGFGPGADPSPAHDVLEHVLRSLGVPADAVPDGTGRRTSLVRSMMVDRRVLVVLDNAADVQQLRPLLPGRGRSRTVVTSRDQLRGLVVEGAHLIALEHLEADDVADLLVRRLGASRVEAEPAAVTELTALTGGLPLALSLVGAYAAFSPNVSLAAVARDVRGSTRRLDAFADGGTDVRDALTWSTVRLPPPTALGFSLLAIHPGPVLGVPAAAALLGLDDRAAADLLDELHRSNLLAVEAAGRFRVHDLVKAHAHDLLEDVDASLRTAAERRLYDWAGASSAAAARSEAPHRTGLHEEEPAAGTPDVEDAGGGTGWLERERQLLVDLVTRPDRPPDLDRPVWQMAWALQHLLDRRGRWEELLRTQTAALAAAERTGPALVQAAIRRGLARALGHQGHPRQARAHVEAALRLATSAAGEPVLVSETHRLASWVHEQAGDVPGALEHARAALATCPEDADAPRAFALNAVGWSLVLLHDDAGALPNLTEAHRLLEGTSHDFGRADVLASLGSVHHHCGRLDEAESCYREAMALLHRLGARLAEADAARELGLVLAAAGDAAGAREAWERALVLLSALGHDGAGEVVALLSTAGTSD